MKVFIPIKKKSVRVPNKNFRDFGGKPLYIRTLDKLNQMEVFIDTDAGSLELPVGMTVYHGLAGQDVPMNDLIGNFLDRFVKGKHELIIQIHVTSPFLKRQTILSIANHFNRLRLTGACDSVVACTDVQVRVWRTEYTPQTFSQRMIPVNHNPMILEPTQHLQKMYAENSLFYIFTKESFKANGNNRVGRKPLFWSVPFPENHDIDTEQDWKMAEVLLNENVDD